MDYDEDDENETGKGAGRGDAATKDAKSDDGADGIELSKVRTICTWCY